MKKYHKHFEMDKIYIDYFIIIRKDILSFSNNSDVNFMTEISPDTLSPITTSEEYKEIKGNNDFLGHPKGLWVLVITEAWIAFSFYGMLSLLVLYMSKEIFISSQNHIFGLSSLLSITQYIYHPVDTIAISSAVMGIFLACIYIGPLFGSLLADKYWGRTRTILAGTFFMIIGEVLLCFKISFVLSLIFILLGNGLAGSMKAQVGALYLSHDRRRSDAYQLYSLGVQVAVILSPILCGIFNIYYPWKGGFLVAAIGMFFAMSCYLLGRKYLPKEETHITILPHKSLSIFEKKRIILLLLLMIVFMFSSLPNEELNDGYILWANEHYALNLLGYHFPVSYLMSLDGFISTVTTIFVLWLLQIYERKFGFIQELNKVSLGCFISALGPIFLILGVYYQPHSHQVNLWWGILFHIFNDIGVALIYSIGMAFFSRIAPQQYNTLFVSLFVMHLVGANLIIGKLGTLLGKISNIDFWGIHILASVISGILFFAIMFFFRRFFELSQEEEKLESPPSS